MKKRIFSIVLCTFSLTTTLFTMEQKRVGLNSLYHPNTTGSPSPDRFKNRKLWQRQSNLKKAHEKSEDIRYLLEAVHTDFKKKQIQFRLVNEAYAKFETLNTLASEDGEPYNREETEKLKEIVKHLAHSMIFDEGIFHHQRAYEKLKMGEEKEENSTEKTMLLQRAKQHAVKAKKIFKDSLSINNDDKSTHEKLSDTQSLIMLLKKRLGWTCQYQQKVSKSKQGYKAQRAAKKKLEEINQAANFFTLQEPHQENENIALQFSHENKQVLLTLYEEAEKILLSAATQHLNASDNYLNKKDIQEAQKILDEIYEIETKKKLLSPIIITQPIITEIANRIEQGSIQLRQQQEGSMIVIRNNNGT